MNELFERHTADVNRASSPMFRRRSIRLPGFDYAGPATYLITMVIDRRIPILGAIRERCMVLSPAGRIVAEEWRRGGALRTELCLDAWVIMPDHFHAIVHFAPPAWCGSHGIHPDGAYDVRMPTRRHRSLGSLVSQFKASTTAQIRLLLPANSYLLGHRLWQRNYHERILRTDAAVDRARRYVLANPSQWRPRGARHMA